ncbi:MAG: LacI family DNA-binding transcriptional regulator [Elstera sp.]
MIKRPPASAPQRQPVASIAEVAERAGVSIATVSRVINGITNKMSRETAERVRAAITELGYRPGSVGRALRRRESRLVAVLAANLANPAMAAIAASTEAALRRNGSVMVLCDTHDRPDLQDEYLLEMRAQLARAIVLLGAVASPQLQEFQRTGEALLLVNRRWPQQSGETVETPPPFVGVDNRAAAQDVAQAFLQRGLSAAAIIHGAITSSATSDRVAAFCETFAAAGHPLDPSKRLAGLPGEEHLEIGYRAMAELLAQPNRATALFCSSDLIAYGAHRRASEAGIRIPEDLMIVGFDDSPLNPWLAPWLSSVEVPYTQYGDAVVESLDAIWSGTPAPVRLLPHRLVLRG